MISLIPISDVNPTRTFPIVTVALIVINIVLFFMEPGLGSGQEATAYFVEKAPIPCQIESECPAGIQFPDGTRVAIPERNSVDFFLSSIHSTFLHAGFLHIIGNMLFLWVFGNNVEDFLGRIKYLLFYLLGGVAASYAHVFANLDSVLPAVGASGAVAAVMGAYIVLFPHARVNVIVPIFIIWTVIQLSALVVLGLWFVYQFLIGQQELTGQGGVAWMAHVGGFVFGVVGIFLLGGRPHRKQQRWSREFGSY